MPTKQQKISATPSDELIRQQIATDGQRQPFYDFVLDKLGLHPFDYSVVLDQSDDQGWRVIDLHVYAADGHDYLSTIYIHPHYATNFPARLDFPF